MQTLPPRKYTAREEEPISWSPVDGEGPEPSTEGPGQDRPEPSTEGPANDEPEPYSSIGKHDKPHRFVVI